MEPSWVLSQAAANILHVIPPQVSRVAHNAYIIPDIGTPNMNTYMEIIGPYNQNGYFGADGVYLNNSGDAVQVVCANTADTNKIVIGPAIVSWNGKMISTQVFGLPDEQPNSDDWRQVNPAFKIPLNVIVNGSTIALPDTFYIVQMQPAIVSSTPGVIGSGGALGFRSKRGAMIVDSLILNGSGIYTINTADCDSTTPGNQGYLPAVILSKGSISIADVQHYHWMAILRKQVRAAAAAAAGIIMARTEDRMRTAAMAIPADRVRCCKAVTAAARLQTAIRAKAE